MALSLSHQVMISVSLVLCACVLMPRLLQGRGEAKPKPEHRKVPIGSNQHFQEVPKAKRPLHVGAKGAKPYPGLDQMKNVMEKEINSEKMGGSSHSLAFTLMPLYAIGVAVFAAYKFTKVKSKEKKSVGEREADKKSKETETQLLQLERHLSQTEQMLNSLLTQLDPLSNCVNTLASSQRDDVMNQLQSIRRLMRESGMDRSALENTGPAVSGVALSAERALIIPASLEAPLPTLSPPLVPVAPVVPALSTHQGHELGEPAVAEVVLPSHKGKVRPIYIIPSSLVAVGGRLTQFLPRWASLTSDPWILSTVRGYQIELCGTPTQSHSPHPPRFADALRALIHSEVADLNCKRAMEPAFPLPTGFISSLFLVSKAGGSVR
uniref:Resistance to inhibitors of cholinesterase protein 3 N-terminal domain-containing protein n=1 Tax=Leptobrachium leishanense TaxID=445787 RepID=A0A8C5PAG8_9ANUR